MRRQFQFILTWIVLSICVEVLAAEPGQAPRRKEGDWPTPHWIWHRDTCGDGSQASVVNDRCRLVHTFQVNGPERSARLRLAGDFCRTTVEINGHSIASVEPYSATTELDVATGIKVGENEIAITAEAVPGPAAVALSLYLVTADGQQIAIVTDDRWLASGSQAVSMGLVEQALWGLNRRSSAIEPFENYEQWRQALGMSPAGDPAAFWTAPGFEISLVRTAQPDEGSWVSMAFDPRGRVTIAREDKGLLRMTLDEAHRTVHQVETINDELQECRGLLYAYESLFVNANNSKGLYRLRDTDADDRIDEVRLLRQFPGSVGHGRNDLALGPDGLIYSIHGDAVDVPKDDVLDHTSPFREARRGQSTKEGYVLRTDREGKQWELLCGGLRNPFGLAFNPAGDLFTYDADAEFDMGTPWYRPTRVLQLVPGADYGWRGVTGKWPPYFPDHPDNALPTLDIGRGSPTAVAFGTQTKFPREYKEALFILDWTYGRILAVHLAPRGAGYRAWAETFLQGRPLNVTDLAVGPDGALYIVTGGRKTQSALYRVAYTGDVQGGTQLSPHERACQEHAAAARKLRLSLENERRGPEHTDLAWPHLNSPDPIIRHAARIAVEHQPVAKWQALALREKRATAALTALVALARAGDKSLFPAIIDRLIAFPEKELDVGQTLAFLHLCANCLANAPDVVVAKKESISAQLDAVFPHPAARWLHVSPMGTGANVQRELARLLAQLGSPHVVEKTVNTLFVSGAQEDRLHGLFALQNVREGWAPNARRAYFGALNDGAKFVSGEGMPKFLAHLREESLKTLSDAERGELADLLMPASETEVSEPLPSPRPVVKNWTLDEFAPLLVENSRKADAARGAVVFRDALCARCHRVGARGPAVGPDLTHVAGRFSRRDLLESILAPSKVVADNYRNVQIRATDGRIVIGRIALGGDYRSEKLHIATDPLRPTIMVELKKQEIEQFGESQTSPMPQGLLDSFRADEVLDLLEFLASGAIANAASP